jgi:hypothetical protein
MLPTTIRNCNEKSLNFGGTEAIVTHLPIITTGVERYAKTQT